MRKVILFGFSVFILTGQYERAFSKEKYNASIIKQDSVSVIEKKLHGSSIWIIRLGFFPNTNDIFNSSGGSVVLGFDSGFNKYINIGWKAELLNTFIEQGNYSGGFFLFGTLGKDFKIVNQLFFIRGGAGFVIINPGITSGGFIELEYPAFSFSGVTMTISVSETFIRLNQILPPVFSVGILF